MSKLRDSLKNKIQDISSCEGSCITDELAYKEADVILALIREAVPKEKGFAEIAKAGREWGERGLGQVDGWNAYHKALMEVLK